MLILGLQKTTLLDYPGKVASTIFTGGCNFRCPYCHNRDLVIPPSDVNAYTEDEIFTHLSQKKKVLDGVCISGGEPTLHKDLPEFISKIKELGLLVKLDSNGTNPQMLKELVKNGLIDYVAMDIKHSKEKYNTIASMKTFDLSPIEESVDFLKEGHVDYEFRTTIVEELHSEADFIELAKMLKGAKRYYLQKFKDSEYCIASGLHEIKIDTANKYLEILRKDLNDVNLRGY